MKVKLFIIDPQNDFMGNAAGTPLTDGKFKAALPVKNAVTDMQRLCAMIKRIGSKLEDISVTLDSHRPIDVAHAPMWQDEHGKMLQEWTMISSANLISGKYRPRRNSLRQRMIDYTLDLEKHGKYMLILWPTHCLIGTWGHNVYAPLMETLIEWQQKEFALVNFITKGSNPFTEHYGGLMAEVRDPEDQSTQLNMEIIRSLQDADIIGICGEASSHCVKATVEQIVEFIGDTHFHKIHLITDCMSPVPQQPSTPDFPAIASDFLQQMAGRGLHLTKSTDFLA